MSQSQKHNHHQRENFAAQTLREISDIPSFAQAHLDKLNFLHKSIDESKIRRGIKSADPSKIRQISSFQGRMHPTIRIYQDIELQHFFGVPSTLKFHIMNRNDNKAQIDDQFRNDENCQQRKILDDNSIKNPQIEIENFGFSMAKSKNQMFHHKRFRSTRETKETRNKSTIGERKTLLHLKNSFFSITSAKKSQSQSRHQNQHQYKNQYSQRQSQLEVYKNIRNQIQRTFSIGGQAYFKDNFSTARQNKDNFRIHGSLKQMIQTCEIDDDLKKKNLMNTICHNRSDIASPRSYQSSPSSRKNVNASKNCKRVYMGRPIYSSKEKKKLSQNRKTQYPQKKVSIQDLPMGYNQMGIGGNRVIFNL